MPQLGPSNKVCLSWVHERPCSLRLQRGNGFSGREPPFDAALFIIHAERGSLMLGVGGAFVILNSNSFTA